MEARDYYTLILATASLQALDRRAALEVLEAVRDDLNSRVSAERARIVGAEVAEQVAYHKPGAQTRAAKALGISKQRVSQMYDEHKEKHTMTTTTEYGTWNNRVESTAHTVEDTVASYISGGDSEWVERCEETGALDATVADYRAAINDALPDGVSLNGNEFYGPYYDDDKDFDGYPTNEDGRLDIAEIVSEIDLGAIVEAHDPDNA